MKQKEFMFIVCICLFAAIFNMYLMVSAWIDYENTGNPPSSVMVISILVATVFSGIAVRNAEKELKKKK